MGRKDCVFRRKFYATHKDNPHHLSKRGIYTCVMKAGFMIKHWKCNGPEDNDCPGLKSIKEANNG
jgi:hypothetical protein